MTDEEIAARYKWHQSQIKFHQQAINRIPGIFTWILSRTLRKHSKRLADNLAQNNALLRRILDGRSRSGKTTTNAPSGGNAKAS